ncbi:hypothetical protein [Pleionea mediterranea]|jgi:Flp pilus assembly protein TadB|nr:hypothetical protein [Pleionea mediterranea]
MEDPVMLTNIILPKGLYELLPAIYFLIAAGLVLYVEHSLSWVPAIIFAACGAVTLKWRLSDRRRNRAASESSR